MHENISFSHNEHPLEHLCPPSPGTRADGSAVHCVHGQNSTTSQSGANTPEPLSSRRAKQTSTVPATEQTAPGDTLSAQGGCYRHPGNGQAYRHRPIRPVGIEPDRALLLMKDPEWWMQEKFSGHHMLVRKTPDGVEGIDVAGLVVALPAPVALAAEKISRRWTIEGVCIGDSFVAFDLLQVNFLDFQSTPYWLRWSGLRELLSPEDPHLRIAETATKTLAKAGLLERLRDDRKAGFVFKKSTGIRKFNPSPEKAFLLTCRFSEPNMSPLNRRTPEGI